MAVKEQKPEGYNLGAIAGMAHERERIIKLLQENFIDSELLQLAVNLIRAEQHD
jgi:hypothetical protein